MATSDEVTLTVERLPEGKMRVTSRSWDHEEGVCARPSARGLVGKRAVPRRPKRQTSRRMGPPVEAYDPYGPGVEVLNDVTGFQEPVTHHSDDVTEA
jgi:hypothetical protein